MRLEFAASTPLLEQRLRVADAKQPGRKHQKRKGAKAKEKERATAKRRAFLKAKKASKLKAAVAAYWRGERDTFPMVPNVEFSGVPVGHSSNHPAGSTSAGTQG